MLSEIDPCDEEPCINGGHCVHDGPAEYHCECPGGYTGTNCESGQ